jgi:hypothetical protein
MKKIVFTAGWDYHTMRVPDDVERAVRADGGLLYGGDPDLTRFFSRGGKCSCTTDGQIPWSRRTQA